MDKTDTNAWYRECTIYLSTFRMGQLKVYGNGIQPKAIAHYLWPINFYWNGEWKRAKTTADASATRKRRFCLWRALYCVWHEYVRCDCVWRRTATFKPLFESNKNPYRFLNGFCVPSWFVQIRQKLPSENSLFLQNIIWHTVMAITSQWIRSHIQI